MRALFQGFIVYREKTNTANSVPSMKYVLRSIFVDNARTHISRQSDQIRSAIRTQDQ